MGRESDDAKDERQRRAGRWLRGQRDDRRLSQKDVADRLGVAQQTYSRYEKGHLAIPYEFVPELAAMLGLSETTVWRSLELPLPRPFRTDADVIAWAWEKAPEKMERATGRKAPRRRSLDSGKPTRVTRKSDNPPKASHGEENAV